MCRISRDFFIMTDYSSKSSKKLTKDGTKARQREDKEDRSLMYRDWRREVGKTEKDGRFRKTSYTTDLDQIEYVFVKDVPIPVAILELTRYDFDEYEGTNHGWAKYRSSILDRYFIRDAQGRVIKELARLLNCEAWIVLFRHDLEAFWLFDLWHKDATWVRKTPEEYKQWLADLRTRKLETLKNECSPDD